MGRPVVSICIPAYKPGPQFLATMQSALAQTVGDIEIIVSNDGGHPCDVLETFRNHPRVRVINQAARLGWVENSNFVLSQAIGQYFMILPHDDQIAPDYVAECLSVLQSEPDTFAVQCDIQTDYGVHQVMEVRGDLERRVSDVLANHLQGTSFRALMRRNPDDWPALKLVRNPAEDVFVDTIFILQQALHGEIRRVAKPLFTKYIGPETTHANWSSLPKAVVRQGWINHCEIMQSQAVSRLPDNPEILALARRRRNPHNVADTERFPYMRDPFTPDEA
jgi:glycosyltransferase involved in cell wall biosynthesis